MKSDSWHYKRNKFASQIFGMFESGLSTALVFFAPRRMGKTEFLLKDMMPLAQKNSWQVFYFSFLDSSGSAEEAFCSALNQFVSKLIDSNKMQKSIKKIEGGTLGVSAALEFRDNQTLNQSVKTLISALANRKNKVLLLLDEVQVLSKDYKNTNFVAALRTALDVHKDDVKVIFTGSSQDGLRRMFSKSDAPFFHFGQNLPFPELDKDFILHLVDLFHRASARSLDPDLLWNAFLEMDKVPQLIRSMVERMILHPEISLKEAQQDILKSVIENREYQESWNTFSALERLLLIAIALDETQLFSEEKRSFFSKQIGIDELPVSTVQSTLRTLWRKHLIGRLPKHGQYTIDDPNFKTWVIQHKIE